VEEKKCMQHQECSVMAVDVERARRDGMDDGLHMVHATRML
jgi:hypothetical protein